MASQAGALALGGAEHSELHQACPGALMPTAPGLEVAAAQVAPIVGLLPQSQPLKCSSPREPRKPASLCQMLQGLQAPTVEGSGFCSFL